VPRSGPASGRGGQFHGKYRALLQLALHRDLPAERLDDLPDDPQAEPEATIPVVGDGALEAIENALLVFLGNANPPIRDL